MAKKPTTKQTSARVSSIASRVMAGEIISPEVNMAIGQAIRAAGIPLNHKALCALCVNVEAALSPVIDDMRTLAASCLSQDEAAGNADD